MYKDYPLVSFIMGMYNTKSISDLDKSIYSILNQTYPNIELIICDDCSTNGIYEYVLNKYGNDERIKVIRNNQNSSLGVSLNNCLKITSGKYIARQDDDDYSSLERIEKQVSFLENNPEYDLVSAGLVKYDEYGIWDEIHVIREPNKRSFRKHSQHVHAATLFRKECLDKVNNYRISWETQRAEDYDLFMRIYANDMKGFNLPEVLYYYNYPRGNKRRIKYKYKIMEAMVRFHGFYLMKLPIIDYIYVFKPLFAGLLPEKMKMYIKRKINQTGV